MGKNKSYNKKNNSNGNFYNEKEKYNTKKGLTVEQKEMRLIEEKEMDVVRSLYNFFAEKCRLSLMDICYGNFPFKDTKLAFNILGLYVRRDFASSIINLSVFDSEDRLTALTRYFEFTFQEMEDSYEVLGIKEVPELEEVFDGCDKKTQKYCIEEWRRNWREHYKYRLNNNLSANREDIQFMKPNKVMEFSF